ncbi:hypothetical protein HaLaN_31850, partial [Haematococcus lacustris]
MCCRLYGGPSYRSILEVTTNTNVLALATVALATNIVMDINPAARNTVEHAFQDVKSAALTVGSGIKQAADVAQDAATSVQGAVKQLQSEQLEAEQDARTLAAEQQVKAEELQAQQLDAGLQAAEEQVVPTAGAKAEEG